MNRPAMENTISRRAALWIALIAGTTVYARQQDRPVPPPGVAVSEADRKELESGLARLSESIKSLDTNTLLPDVQIFHDAVHYALAYDEFFDPPDIPKAKDSSYASA